MKLLRALGPRISGDGGARGIEQAPRPAAPRLGGIGDADPWCCDQLVWLPAGLEAKGGLWVQEVSARVDAGDVEGRRDEPGPGCEPRLRQPLKPLCLPCPARPCCPGRATAGRRSAPPFPGDSRLPHRRPTLDRLDRANQHGGGQSLGLGDNVEAVVHPVDKVHVGDPGTPVHDRVARRPAEPGVRRQVVLADVRLDLDDPPGAPPTGVFANQQRAEQRLRGFERGSGEVLAPERGSSGQRSDDAISDVTAGSTGRAATMKVDSALARPGPTAADTALTPY